MDGWMDRWVGVKAVLRIAYSNQKFCSFWIKWILDFGPVILCRLLIV
jgi:hypothetical protein